LSATSQLRSSRRFRASVRCCGPAAENEIAAKAAERTHVVAASLQTPIKSLSGGNQQRAMFSRWLLAEPKVAIFDEPTRGVDVGAKADIYRIIDSISDGGIAS
jgi:ribose transport system ATP-binding protein